MAQARTQQGRTRQGHMQQACGALRGGFREELDLLSREVVDLGLEVDGSLGTLVDVLECPDTARVRRMTGFRNDAYLRSQSARLDEECMVLQARQAPVACDLRLLHAVRAVTDHVMRAGALCEQAFRALDETSRQTSGTLDATLARMSRRTHALFRQGLRAFEHRCP